ncbi:enoyl-CoA hydratase/isomerase family protein [Chloroflexota bacterium]
MPDVLYEKREKEHIAVFTLNRPERLNAISKKVTGELKKITADFVQDENLWVAIVTGAGDKAFSAGGDLIEMAEQAKAGKLDLKPETFDSVFPFHRAETCPKPVIAAVNGLAVGGGCELALSADIRIASDNAYFGLFEIKRGIMAGFSICNLMRLMPFGEAMYYMLTADRMTVEEAHKYGLVQKVVPKEKLMSVAEGIARAICENAPLSVRNTKATALYYRNLLLDEHNDYMGPLYQMVTESEDAKEGTRAFVEKRQPIWKGR